MSPTLKNNQVIVVCNKNVPFIRILNVLHLNNAIAIDTILTDEWLGETAYWKHDVLYFENEAQWSYITTPSEKRQLVQEIELSYQGI